MLRIHMLPAGHGDALWIEYGKPLRRILIDAGTTGTHKKVREKVAALPAAERTFELLVVTHVDADHIGGVVSLLKPWPDGLAFKDVWFNGYRHLVELETFGPVQGEKLTAWLDGLEGGAKWNAHFQKKAVKRPDAGPLPAITLPGDLTLTLLGPTAEKLKDMIPVWEKECKKAGLDPTLPEAAPVAEPPGLESFGALNVDTLADTKFVEDKGEPNGSSITLLLEHDGKRVLLGADAHPSTVIGALDLLSGAGKKTELTALKLPHHGSKNNINRELLERIKCRRYLFSSNGDHFQHPHPEGVARVLKYGGAKKEVFFNFKTEFTKPWLDDALQEKWDYTAKAGDDKNGIVVDL